MNKVNEILNKSFMNRNIYLIKKEFITWDKIYKRSGYDNGILDGAFCKAYHIHNCFRCPVKLYTGKKFCVQTPYEKWQNHQFTIHKKYDKNISGFEILCTDCKKLVLDEINFLWKVFNSIKNGELNYNE